MSSLYCDAVFRIRIRFSDPDQDFFPKTDPNPDSFSIRIWIRVKKHIFPRQ